MGKSELAIHVARQTGLSQSKARTMVTATFDAIRDGLARHGRVRIRGFGTFTSRTRAPRESRHPVTHEPIQLPAFRTVTFKPSRVRPFDG